MVRFSKYVPMLIFLIEIVTLNYNQIYTQILSKKTMLCFLLSKFGFIDLGKKIKRKSDLMFYADHLLCGTTGNLIKN